ncbi:MAG: protease complex subunit PrcB family protein [Pseudomonadales bacterium]|nr:protease complex subunit PrcB family protein [Pseudomonadales bacterium]
MKIVSVGVYVTFLLLVACNTTNEPLVVTAVYGSSQCFVNQQQISKIKTQQELTVLMDKGLAPIQRRLRVGAKPEAVPPVDSVNVDFEKHDVYLISQGSKSSAGYSIKLASEVATIENDTLILPIEIKQPRRGTMQAQLMTSPCLVISLPKARYSKVLAGNLQL